MADVSVFYTVQQTGTLGSFDIQLVDGDLSGSDELQSAVLLSLFSNRRAEADDPLDNPNDPQGFWADSDYGSRLWLLTREKQTPDVAVRAKQYCDEALQWLLTNSIAKTVLVTSEWIAPGRLSLGITITKADNVAIQYQFLWNF